MLKSKIFTAGLFMAMTATASAAPYGFFDARSLAMGNASVATGGLTTAAFANPAMLGINQMDESFVFHVGVGAAAIDNGGVVDLVDEIDDLEALLQSQIAALDFNGAAITMEQQRLALLELTQPGTSAILDANGNTALVFSVDALTLAVSYKARVSAGVGFRNAVDLGVPITPANVATLNPSLDVLGFGILTQELGVSIAKDFSLLGMDVSIGVRPKNVSVEVADYLVNTNNNVDLGDISDNTQDLGSFVTLDAGAVIQVFDSLQVGVFAENLIPKTLNTTPTILNPTSRDIEFDTKLRAGLSFQNELLTLAADLDLTESDPILDEAGSRMLAMGVEIDLGDIVQLRGGYQTNVASESKEDDLLSAGIGLWLGFNLDIAVVASEDSIGGFVQTGFRF